jgi:hypothetical protein
MNFNIHKSLESENDSTYIDLQIFNQEDSLPIQYANIEIRDSENCVNSKVQGGITTDINGYGHTRIIKKSNSIWLEIKYINLQTAIIELSQGFKFKIVGYLVFKDEGRINGDVRKFQILTNNNKILRIKDLNDKKISIYHLKE